MDWSEVTDLATEEHSAVWPSEGLWLIFLQLQMNFLPLLAETPWNFKPARKATKLLNLTVIQCESNVEQKQPVDFFLCVQPGSINMNVYLDADQKEAPSV